MMERYRNFNGDSGIVLFEIDSDSITVRFRDGSIYLYTNQSAGSARIDHMKRLARSGRGLNSFISRVVKNGYARKLRC